MNPRYEKLKALLMELFQLDQPDLDFGLYRIMHAKSAEVTQFLDGDLLPQVKAAFAEYTTADKSELEKELAKVVAGLEAAGVDPEQAPKVQELRVRMANESVDIAGLEAEVYDHLFRFFRRYYSEGDFLSKRVYKEGVYAIPYEGEEVKLHWANADQYYVKTSEYLRDYAFRLRPENDARPLRVHFRLVDAAEGEHGNVKATQGKDRVFILAAEDFLHEEDGPQGKELILHFEYRSATMEDWPEGATRDKAKKPPTQKDLLALAEQRILNLPPANPLASSSWIPALAAPHVKANGESADYSRLRAHLNRYAARNTFDYFIHKDLGTFLRRELDFYIKNEIMHLDDVENATAPRVEQYLSKIKVVRKIAKKVIDFLAQLEDFQKKLWLKKKFVVETNYCITLDRVPEELYPEIVANDAQLDEWINLLAIEDILGVDSDLLGLGKPAFSRPLTVDFLKANDGLVLDTRFFDDYFRSKLLGLIENFDARCDGLLVHSENFQALNLIERRLHDSVKTIYIDPPYNTASSEIIYKNGYRVSSWNSLIHNNLPTARRLLRQDGILCATIDDEQQKELAMILSEHFGAENVLGSVCIRINPSGRITLRGFAQAHEYALFYGNSHRSSISKIPRSETQAQRFNLKDSKGMYEQRNFRREGSASERQARPKRHFPIYVSGEVVRVPPLEWQPSSTSYKILQQPRPDEIAVLPIDSNGGERVWRWGIERIENEIEEIYPKTNSKGELQLYYKYRPNEEGILPSTVWIDKVYSATEYGTAVLKKLFGARNEFSFPKSIHAVIDCIKISSACEDSVVILDYFAGSGTTGHAVVSLNRADGGLRKYVLVEMGAHFDTTLKPRITKIVYSNDWKEGKPKSRDTGISHCFKYIRLESYEDTLNNLDLRRSAQQQELLEHTAAQGTDQLKEQYMLRYMLDVETAGSASLLNVAAFSDPTAYTLTVKRPGTDESRDVNVDLVETFNWLIGLTVQHLAAPQTFSAAFTRDGEGRLHLKGRIQPDETGPFWFRTVTGTTPDGRKTLVLWRKLTGNLEEDNLVLDTWFTKQGYSTKDFEFQLIYVNGDNNLENLKTAADLWKVRLIEEDFHRLMFDTEGI